MQNLRTLEQPLFGEKQPQEKRERERKKEGGIAINAQGQRTYFARTKISAYIIRRQTKRLRVHRHG